MNFGIKTAGVCAAFLLGAVAMLFAQASQGARGGSAPAGPGRGGGGRGGPGFDQAAVDRGQGIFVANCGFCHGSNAKGGEGGPDLIRSVLVLDDDNGKQIGELLKTGRPDKGMPRFELPQAQISDIATFLHQRIAAAATRSTYQILDIVVGDAKAGEEFFNGAGKCNTCHSVAGDLKGIGSKYDPATLQGRVILPRGRGGFAGPPSVPELSRLTPTVTVTLSSGQSVAGLLVRLTDFDVTLQEASGAVRTVTRTSESVPKVELKDPLQAHLDMLPKYKDSDIHNLTAYLVTLK